MAHGHLFIALCFLYNEYLVMSEQAPTEPSLPPEQKYQVEVEVIDKSDDNRNRKIKIIGTAAAITLAVGGLYALHRHRKKRH